MRAVREGLHNWLMSRTEAKTRLIEARSAAFVVCTMTIQSRGAEQGEGSRAAMIGRLTGGLTEFPPFLSWSWHDM